MITLHHLESSGSHRIIWLLEELELSYHIERHQVNPETGAVDGALLAVHPLAKAPVLVDDKQVIAGCGAIVDYVLNKYDRSGLRPPICSSDYSQYQQWMYYSDSQLLPLFQQQARCEKLANTRVPFFARSILKKVVNGVLSGPIASEIEQHLNFIEDQLSANGWSSGSQFSAADIQLSFALETAKSKGLIDSTHFPNVDSFLNSIAERPAYQIALEKAGSKVYALPVSTTSEVTEDDANDTQQDNTNNQNTDSQTNEVSEAHNETNNGASSETGIEVDSSLNPQR